MVYFLGSIVIQIVTCWNIEYQHVLTHKRPERTEPANLDHRSGRYSPICFKLHPGHFHQLDRGHHHYHLELRCYFSFFDFVDPGYHALTMNKDYRKVVRPSNTWFIELDFNAAELRCLLALNDQAQPEQDIHEWHGCIFNKLSDHKLSRDDIKRKIFGWLYGPLGGSLGVPEVEKHYDKRRVLNKYWDGSLVTNPFGRQIIADEFHALNAIIQSTTSDTFLRRAIAVNKLLENKKSFTMGLIHDSMVIDFHREDKDLIDDIIKEFGDTDLGKFKVNTSLGTHFGNLKRFR